MSKLFGLVGCIVLVGCSNTPSCGEGGCSDSPPAVITNVDATDTHSSLLGTANVEGNWVGGVYVQGDERSHAVVSGNQKDVLSALKQESEISIGSVEGTTSLESKDFAVDNSLSPGKDTCQACKPIGEVFFAMDSSELTAEGRNTLDKIILSGVRKIEIIGYADAIGNSGYNRSLALLRAEAVRNYMTRMKSIEVRTVSGIESRFEGDRFRKAILVGL